MFLFFMWIGSSLDLMFFYPEGVQEMERSKCYEEPNGDTQLAIRGGAVHLKMIILMWTVFFWGDGFSFFLNNQGKIFIKVVCH